MPSFERFQITKARPIAPTRAEPPSGRRASGRPWRRSTHLDARWSPTSRTAKTRLPVLSTTGRSAPTCSTTSHTTRSAGEEAEEEAGAAPGRAHQRVGEREAGDEVHAQLVEPAAELGLGRVHRHAPGTEQHHHHGVRRGQAGPGQPPGGQPGVPADGEAGHHEAEVAQRVGRLPEQARPGRLAEAVTASDVGAEPPVARGEVHQEQRDGRRATPRGRQGDGGRRRRPAGGASGTARAHFQRSEAGTKSSFRSPV